MKKRILLCALCLAAALMLTGCTMLPLGYLSGMTGPVSTREPAQAQQPAVSGDTVTISRAEYERYKQLDELAELMELVEDNYYQDTDRTQMLEGAAAGLLEGVGDPYTFYYTPEEFAQLWEDDSGEYAGIGIQISISYDTNICTISRVFEGGPAEQAGVRRGDILYAVGEDLFVTAENIDDAIKLMRQKPGTEVTVSFLRDGEVITYRMKCANVTTNRVESAMIDSTVGYIRLYEFAGDCSEKFKAALDTLVGEGAKGIIIDLRDNGGGWVNDAESIGDLFLDRGVLCYLEYKDGSREYYRTKDGKADVKLVILVNEYTASSSEILTGALRDRANATVVGVNSYGKGIVQTVQAVGNRGAGMQMTIAQYYTPNGNALHQVGIAPDVEIAMPEEDIHKIFQLADLSDVQLNKAYEVMQGLLAE